MRPRSALPSLGMWPTYLSAAQLETAPSWLRAFGLFVDDATGPGVTAPRLRRFAGIECLNLFNAPGDDADLLAAVLAEHPALHTLHLSTRYTAKPLSLLPLAGRALTRGIFSLGAALDATAGNALSGVRSMMLIASTVTPAGLAALTAVEDLDLPNATLTAPAAAALATLPSLRTLRCGASGSLASLGGAASLEHLELRGRALTADEAVALAARPTLRALDVTACTAADLDALGAFASSTARVHVRLAPAEGTLDDLLRRLARSLPSLAALSLQPAATPRVKAYTPDGLQALSGIEALEWLSLRMLRLKGLKPAHLAGLRALPRLRHLSLAEATAWGATVTEVAKDLTSLHTLDLLGAPVSDASCKHLAKLSLRALRVSDATLGPRGLAQLSAADAPRRLDLGVEKGGFTDDGLRALAGYTNLEQLHLTEGRGPGEDPTTLAPLCALPRLRALSVGLAGSTNAWLSSLAAAPSLEAFALTRRWSPGRVGQLGPGAVTELLRCPTLRVAELLEGSVSTEEAAALEASGRLAVGHGSHSPDDLMTAALAETLRPDGARLRD